MHQVCEWNIFAGISQFQLHINDWLHQTNNYQIIFRVDNQQQLTLNLSCNFGGESCSYRLSALMLSLYSVCANNTQNETECLLFYFLTIKQQWWHSWLMHISYRIKRHWNDYVNSTLREPVKCSHGSYRVQSWLLLKNSILQSPNWFYVVCLAIQGDLNCKRQGPFHFKCPFLHPLILSIVFHTLLKVKKHHIKSTKLRMNPPTHSASFMTIHLLLCSLVNNNF